MGCLPLYLLCRQNGCLVLPYFSEKQNMNWLAPLLHVRRKMLKIIIHQDP